MLTGSLSVICIPAISPTGDNTEALDDIKLSLFDNNEVYRCQQGHHSKISVDKESGCKQPHAFKLFQICIGETLENVVLSWNRVLKEKPKISREIGQKYPQGNTCTAEGEKYWSDHYSKQWIWQLLVRPNFRNCKSLTIKGTIIGPTKVGVVGPLPPALLSLSVSLIILTEYVTVTRNPINYLSFAYQISHLKSVYFFFDPNFCLTNISLLLEFHTSCRVLLDLEFSTSIAFS